MKQSIQHSQQSNHRASADSTNSHAKSLPAQMVAVGLVPKVPGTYRSVTTAAYDGSGNPRGGKGFNGAQRTSVYADNVANGGGAAPVLAGANHPLADKGGYGLIERDLVSDHEPEIDHIIPIAEGGSNDLENARVISKTQNTGGANQQVPNRPNANGKGLRIYRNTTIAGTAYNDGDIVPNADVNNLAVHAGLGMVAKAGDLTAGNINTICATGAGTANGITIV